MDAKLKALKVVDLKHILAAAAVSVPAKATKPDLIAKILASPPAQDAYASLYPPDDLLAPPEDVDWNVDQLGPPTNPASAPAATPAAPTPAPAPASAPAPAKAPALAPASAPASAPTPTPASHTPSSAEVDEELEKRKKRAERFGIPLVKPRENNPRTTAPKSSLPGLDPNVLQQRAARFGLAPTVSTDSPAPNPKKRSAAQEHQVDPEEAERRRKRAERFGTHNKA